MEDGRDNGSNLCRGSGPLRNFEVEVDAAVRLHQTGRSCVAQQFRKLDSGSADKPVGRRRSIM